MTVSSRGSAERRQAMVEYLKQMSSIVMETKDKDASASALSAIVTEIKGKEALISTDQKLSKVLEKLIETNANSEVVRNIWNQINSVVLDIIYDQYGSHVLETLIKSLSSVEFDDELYIVIQTFTESICSDIYNLIADNRATHVVRSAALIFGGIIPQPSQGDENMDILTYLKSDKCRHSGTDKPNKVLLRIFGQILDAASRISMPEMDQLIGKPHSSMTIQILLLVGSKNKNRKLLEQIAVTSIEYIECCLEDKIKSKFIELVVELSMDDEKICEKFIDNFFFEKSPVIAEIDGENDVHQDTGRHSNRSSQLFSLQYVFGFMQSLISKMSDSKIFTRIIENFFTSDCMIECVQKGRGNGIGVMQRLAEKLVEFPESQRLFFERFLTAIGIDNITDKGKYIWSRILSLSVSYFGEAEIIWDEIVTSITPAGCLLVSTIMGGFKQSAVQSMISNAGIFMDSISSDFLTSKWMKEVYAGRCLQTLISTNSSLPTGTRKKIIKLVLLGGENDRLAKIVVDRRVGSWLVTCAWDSCAGDVELKKQLGEKLIAVEGLRENFWKVWRHCGLASFSRRNNDWTEGEKRKAKVQSVFQDIIGDQKSSKKLKN